MNKVLVVSSDKELNRRLSTICSRFKSFFVPVFMDDMTKALEYIRYELPEINVLNFSDFKVDAFQMLTEIKKDPWLHYGGIVAVYARKDESRLSDAMKDSNILAMIPRGHFVRDFVRLLKILLQNRQIIFQRDMQNYLLGDITSYLVMDNDPFNAGAYANLITNFLYNSNYIDKDQKERVQVAIFEMLLNAIEHGNCDISYEEKTKWLESGGNILDLIREKGKDPKIKKKRVFLSYRITPERSFFTIRDEGKGFDWRKRMQRKEGEVNLSQHGHGIIMTDHYMENLWYNDAGNEVSFELAHQSMESNTIPSIFSSEDEILFKDGDVVFEEGEESNFLYYIVSGKLEVYSGSNLISVLSPADLFLGEMSFLLNNQRSAHVVSKGPSVLVKISKNAFVNLIKENPHYGIFLARLLANRLNRLNAFVARLDGAVYEELAKLKPSPLP